MARPKLSFGNRSLVALGLLVIGTQGFHPKLLLMLEHAQTAAWLLAILTGMTAALLLWPAVAALRSVPGGTLIDLVGSELGVWGRIPVAMVLAAAIAFASGLILRETSEMALSAVFPHTPQTFVTSALLLGAVIVSWGDGSSIVRLGAFLLPLLLISLLLVVVGTVGWGEPQYLLPFWGPGLPRILLGLPSATAIHFPVIALLSLTGAADDRRGLVRWFPAIPLLGGLLLAVLKAVLAMVFAYPIGQHIPFPLHSASRIVLGGRFFERLEGIWVFVWVCCTTVLLGLLLHAAAQTFTRAFRIARVETAVLPLAAVVLTVAFFPRDQAQTIEWHLGVTGPLFLLVFLFPAALGLFALGRQRWMAK